MAGLYSFLYLYKAFFVVIVLSGQCSSYLLFFSCFSSSSVPGNFLFSGLPGTAFLFHFNWNIFMKSYAGNWQINHNSRNRMSKKILSERIPLDGQWNNRTSPTWPETRHGREGRSRTSFFFFNKIDEIKWQSNTRQSVLKSKGVYRTGGHLPDLSDGISFSLIYAKTCRSITSLEPAFVFGLCRLKYWDFVLSLDCTGFSFYSGFSLDMFHCIYKT